MLSKEELKKLGLTDDQVSKIEAALSEKTKEFIPKHRFDEINARMKSAEQELTTKQAEYENLQKSIKNKEKEKDGEDEPEQIDIASKLDEIEQKLTNNFTKTLLQRDIDVALAEAGAKHRVAVRPFLKFDDIKYDDKGSIVGLKEQLDALKASDETKYLFSAPEAEVTGVKPDDGQSASLNPDTNKTLREALAQEINNQK